MLFEPFGKLRAGSSEFIFGRFLGTFSKKVPREKKRENSRYTSIPLKT